jgi:hypothetical protein
MSARPGNGRLPWWYARPSYLLLFEVFLLTMVALGAAVWVAVYTSSKITGLHDSNVNTAQFIRERNHIFLVRPEWITGSTNGMEESDAWWRWLMAETKARCGVVFILWLTGVSLLIWRYRQRRTQAMAADHPGHANLTGG